MTGNHIATGQVLLELFGSTLGSLIHGAIHSPHSYTKLAEAWHVHM